MAVTGVSRDEANSSRALVQFDQDPTLNSAKMLAATHSANPRSSSTRPAEYEAPKWLLLFLFCGETLFVCLLWHDLYFACWLEFWNPRCLVCLVF